MKKLLEVIPAEEISSSDFEQIENLEKIYYPDIPESEQFSSEKCIHLHNINKDALLLVKEKDKVVAFMHLLPLKVNCYKKIRSGKYPDTIIEEKDIIRYTRKEVVRENSYGTSTAQVKAYNVKGFDDSVQRSAGKFYDDYILSEYLSENALDFTISYLDSNGNEKVIIPNTNEGLIEFANFVAYTLIPAL